MTALALKGNGSMADDGGGLWIGAAGLAVGVVSGLIGFFFRAMTWSAKEGRSEGELRQWKQIQESNIRTLEAKIDAGEARATARIAALESRSGAVELRLATLPTRDEIDAKFDKLDAKLDRLEEYNRRMPH